MGLDEGGEGKGRKRSDRVESRWRIEGGMRRALAGGGEGN